MSGIDSLGGGELSSVSSVLSRPADEFGNDATMEYQWAVKAYHHAETYFKLISSVNPSLLRLTQIDTDIYEEFRKQFPDLDVSKMSEDEMKSEESKQKWREYLNPFEGKVEDWNMGTLMRLDAAMDISDTNTTLVPRIQFLAVEIARNREGVNTKALHGNKEEKS